MSTVKKFSINSIVYASFCYLTLTSNGLESLAFIWLGSWRNFIYQALSKLVIFRKSWIFKGKIPWQSELYKISNSKNYKQVFNLISSSVKSVLICPWWENTQENLISSYISSDLPNLGGNELDRWPKCQHKNMFSNQNLKKMN